MMSDCFLFSIFFEINCKFTFFIDISANVGIDPDLPIDITPYGTIKDVEPQKLRLPAGYVFPSTENRRFKEKWLNDFVWLEYSISKNAAFCYACRQFSSSNEKDIVFKKTGFTNWKTALESNKGFKKHQKTAIHINSLSKWSEAISRKKNKSSVHEIASGNVLQYRRNYVIKIIEVLQFYSRISNFSIFIIYKQITNKHIFFRSSFFWLRMNWPFVDRMILKNTLKMVCSKSYSSIQKKTTKILPNGNHICHSVILIGHRKFKIR